MASAGSPATFAAIVHGRNVYEFYSDRSPHGPRGPSSGYYDLVAVDVYRASADGSATQNLTSELPVAWR